MATHGNPPLIIIINSQPLQRSPLPPSSSLWASSYPIIAISILGILTAAILLLVYYIFAVRCCFDRHRHDSDRLRLARSRMGLSRGADRPSFSAIYSSTTTVHRGLDESTIQAIPTLKFRRAAEQRSSSTTHECAVCLNEFRQDETIKLLPSCLHMFHVDCIGTWLQTHGNCPLCRSEITSSNSLVIDVGDDENAIAESDESPGVCGNDGKLRKLPSMGDECVDARGRGDRSGVEPVRRSFSVDSLRDQQLYSAVQEILRQNQHFRDVGDDEGTSTGSRRSRRPSSLFSSGSHCRSANQQ